jgi:DUF1680 family protein
MSDPELTKEEAEIVVAQMECLKAITQGALPFLQKAGIAYKLATIDRLADDICYRIATKEEDA